MRRSVKKRFAAVFLTLLAVITSLVLPIGAEVTPATAPEYESPVDWSDYPGTNLFPYPYVSFASGTSISSNGVTYELHDYGLIFATGATTSSLSRLDLVYDVYLEAGTYTLASDFGNENILLVGWVKGSGNEYTVTGTFTLSSPAYLDFYIAVLPVSYSFSVDIGPTLNRSDTAAPYQPYLQYWLQQASNSGYSQGYQSGLVVGMDEASKGTNNLFYACTMYLSFTDESEFSRYTFTYDQLPFDKGVLRLGDLPGIVESDWSYPNIDVRFEWPTGGEWYYPSGNIKTNVFPDILTARVLNPPVVDGQARPYVDGYVYFPVGQNGEFGTVEFNYNYYYISTLSFQFQGLGSSNLNSYKDLAFVSNSYQYTSGYSKGYADGLGVASQQYIEEGYAKGVNVGYKQGYAAGKEAGMQSVQSGDFNNLMTSVVDAPLRVITGLLDFEILGMNMLNFLGSLLTVCLLIIFIKKVVL